MKITVDRSRCADHGQCILAAPEVFRWGEDGKLEYDEEPAPEFREFVEMAGDSCPVQAILLEG